jgi:hypothetical protein
MVNNLTPIRKRIYLQCPIALVTAFAVPSCYFEDGYLKLMVAPGKYTPIATEQKGDYQFSMVGAIAPTIVRAYGFEAVIEHNDVEMFNLVEAIALSCTSNDGTVHTPLQVLDYCKPDGQSRSLNATTQEWYTVRSGRITSLQFNGSGMGIANPADLTAPTLLYGQGFTLRFMESVQRRAIG